MRALSVLIALHAVLSSGEQWVVGTQVYPALNNNQYLNTDTKNVGQIYSVSSKPVQKNLIGNKVIQNNKDVNNLLYYAGQKYYNDLDINQSPKKPASYRYLLNKGDLANAQITDYKPNNQLLVSENIVSLNNQPWGQQKETNGLHPNDNKVKPDPNNNECYDLLDTINDLRLLLRKNNISEEKHNLKVLFGIITNFIINNNLVYLPFSVVVQEIGEVLLNAYNGDDTLKESEIYQLLEDFRVQELDDFFGELRTNSEANLPDVVLRFGHLLNQLKQLLVYKGYSQNNIQLVLKRAVERFVPLVAYYLEKDCKLKTQKYIVENLELVLNINFDKLKIKPLILDLGKEEVDLVATKNLWRGLDNSVNNVNFQDVVATGNLLNTGGLIAPENLVGHGLGSVGSQRSLESPSSLDYDGSYRGSGNPEGLENLNNLEDLNTNVNPAELVNSGSLVNPGVGGLGNQVNIQ